MQQERIRTIHVYLEGFDEEEGLLAEDEGTTIEADPEPGEAEPTRYKPLGIICGLFLSLVCLVIPILATMLPQVYPNTYDTTMTKTLHLTLALHPGKGEVGIVSLPQIKKREQLAVSASGSFHQEATKAIGLITFYNGSFAQQIVPAGTRLTGKDGIVVVTEQEAMVPAATPTSPPTDGTVSVRAQSTVAGALGNIAVQDINTVCCGGTVLAQNLYGFSGGEDAKDVPVLTKSDLSTGSQQLTNQVNAAVTDQAQQEIKPGYILLPLTCQTTLIANHQAGDQVSTAVITLTEICTPLAYFAAAIPQAAQEQLHIPQGYQLVSFTALVVQSNTTATGGTLTVQAIVYLKQRVATVSTYHFAGK